jgi:hypothetical protein
MQPLLNIRADSSSIYDGLKSRGTETIFETTPQATLTIEDNPFGSSRYSIDTYHTSGEWSFPRAIKENISFYGRTLSKFTVATWFKVIDNSGNGVFGLGFGNNSPYSSIFISFTTTSAIYGYQIGADQWYTIASFNRLSLGWHYGEFTYNEGLLTVFLDGVKIGTINTISKSISITGDIQLYIQNWFYIPRLIPNRYRGYLYDLIMFDDVWHTDNYELPTSEILNPAYFLYDKNNEMYGIHK